MNELPTEQNSSAPAISNEEKPFSQNGSKKSFLNKTRILIIAGIAAAVIVAGGGWDF